MFKPVVAVMSIIAGGALAAAIVQMQKPTADFTIASELPAVTQGIAVRVEPAPSTIVEDEPETPAQPPPAVVPKPKRTPTTIRKAPPAEAPPVTLGPCSGWRDVGVKATAGPAGTEARNVRALCPQ